MRWCRVRREVLEGACECEGVARLFVGQRCGVIREVAAESPKGGREGHEGCATGFGPWIRYVQVWTELAERENQTEREAAAWAGAGAGGLIKRAAGAERSSDGTEAHEQARRVLERRAWLVAVIGRGRAGCRHWLFAISIARSRGRWAMVLEARTGSHRELLKCHRFPFFHGARFPVQLRPCLLIPSCLCTLPTCLDPLPPFCCPLFCSGPRRPPIVDARRWSTSRAW